MTSPFETDVTDYQKYRGKCKEMSEQLVKEDPLLRLVRGHYFCPVWGKQPHWWCELPDGTVIDPTVNQFPTKGDGAYYVEFNGICNCSECGKEIKEEDAQFESNYVFCSGQCYGRFVGVF